MFDNYTWSDKLPDKNLEVFDENLMLFFATMMERQMIWHKRFIEKKPSPWTEDDIFRDYKFTNVYRELDRSSQWQIKNIIVDNDMTLENYIWKIMVFRYFNNPETFEFAKSTRGWEQGIPDLEDYNPEEFLDMLKDVRDSGAKPFTNAYYINSGAAPGKTRDYCYSHVTLMHLKENVVKLIKIVKNAKSPEEIIKYIKTFPSASDFIAHEFYQDFTYIPKYSNRGNFMSFDQNDFTNVGPGASLGLRLIFPSMDKKNWEWGVRMLRDLAEDELLNIGDFPYLHWSKKNKKYFVNSKCNITLHQIEMWLCEFQKYWKMTIGEGKQRSKFKPKK